MKRRNRLPVAAGVSMLVCLLAPGALPAVAAPQSCRVVVGADGTAALGGLSLNVDYNAAGGEFAGTGDGVECTSLAPGVFTTARDDDADRVLQLAMISVIGVALPQDFWGCTFVSESGAPGSESFTVTVHEAVDPVGAPVVAAAVIRSIECGDMAVCGNGILEGSEECDDGMATVSCDEACRLTYDSVRCEVDMRASGSTAIAGIQFQVDYTDAPGEFVGQGASVACSTAIESALADQEDDDTSRQIRFAMIAPTAIDLPADLWRCLFAANPGPLPLADFRFEDVVAIDSALEEVPVQVQAVAGACTFGPRCGDGIVEDGVEECDDGNDVNTDECTNACTLPICGDANGDGFVRANDALQVLRAAVGQPVVCALYRCDADNNGAVQAGDALRILRKAVGQPIALVCPAP